MTCVFRLEKGFLRTYQRRRDILTILNDTVSAMPGLNWHLIQRANLLIPRSGFYFHICATYGLAVKVGRVWRRTEKGDLFLRTYGELGDLFLSETG